MGLHDYPEDQEISTGETIGACRRRLRDIIRRHDCEAAAGVSDEEVATLSADEQVSLLAIAADHPSQSVPVEVDGFELHDDSSHHGPIYRHVASGAFVQLPPTGGRAQVHVSAAIGVVFETRGSARADLEHAAAVLARQLRGTRFVVTSSSRAIGYFDALYEALERAVEELRELERVPGATIAVEDLRARTLATDSRRCETIIVGDHRELAAIPGDELGLVRLARVAGIEVQS